MYIVLPLLLGAGAIGFFAGEFTQQVREHAQHLTPKETLHFIGIGVCQGHGLPSDTPVFFCEDGYQAALSSKLEGAK